MKKSNLLLASGLATILLASGASAATLTSLVGDKDSFGTDKPDGSSVSVNEILAGTPDAGDGQFDLWSPGVFDWTHVFDLTGLTVTGASLTIATFDMEDNGAGDGLGGGPYDSTLTVDGVEIAGAFDDVFTPDGAAGDPAATILPVNITTFDLASFLPSLMDGSVTFILNPFAGTSGDAISVDYAELSLTVSPVPLPAGLPLLLAGLGGFAVLRRKQG